MIHLITHFFSIVQCHANTLICTVQFLKYRDGGNDSSEWLCVCMCDKGYHKQLSQGYTIHVLYMYINALGSQLFDYTLMTKGT